VTRQIRRWRPDLIITQNPNRTSNLYGSHRDHRITAGVVLDCVYPLARDHMAFPELMPDYEPHKVREIYLMQWNDPELLVDIADTMDLKLKALACHLSQIGDFPGLEKRMRERSAEIGAPRGYAYAEAFDRIAMPR
jgi:LmbE family N-acetylglucosaminyl deacetylase